MKTNTLRKAKFLGLMSICVAFTAGAQQPTTVAFVLSGIGATLVWPFALYSCRAFAAVRNSTLTTPVACA
jgi:hypothetical protein